MIVADFLEDAVTEAGDSLYSASHPAKGEGEEEERNSESDRSYDYDDDGRSGRSHGDSDRPHLSSMYINKFTLDRSGSGNRTKGFSPCPDKKIREPQQ